MRYCPRVASIGMSHRAAGRRDCAPLTCPLAKQIPPSPGSRAERYVQLLSADTFEEAEPVLVSESTGEPTPARSSLQVRVEMLETEVATLRSALSKLAVSVGEPDPFPPSL